MRVLIVGEDCPMVKHKVVGRKTPVERPKADSLAAFLLVLIAGWVVALGAVALVLFGRF